MPLAAVLVLAVLVYGGLASRAGVGKDGCRSDRAPGRAVAVLLDYPDDIPPSEEPLLRGLLARLARDADEGDRFSIVVLDPHREHLFRTLFSACRPRRGSDPGVSPLRENPKLLDRTFETRFAGPLETMLRDLTKLVTPANTSPLLEALHELGSEPTAFPPGTAHRELVIVSDLRQHSPPPGISVYRKQCLPPESALYLQPDTLRGVAVQIVRRPFGEVKGCTETQVLDLWERSLTMLRTGPRSMATL